MSPSNDNAINEKNMNTMTSTCARVETWLALETIDKITKDEQTKLDAHLDDCEACADLRSVLSATSSADAPVIGTTGVIVISKRKAIRVASAAMAGLALAASIAVVVHHRAPSPGGEKSASIGIGADPSSAGGAPRAPSTKETSSAAAAGTLTMMAAATTMPPSPPATATSTAVAVPLPSSSPSGNPQPSQPPIPGTAGTFLSIMEGGNTPRICTNATSEVLDPDSSHPRFILWADCPDYTRFSMVSYPQKLPGKVTNIHGARFMDRKGQEWKSTDASMNVTQFEKVGGYTEGNFEATMSPRLNRDAVKIVAKFRAVRTGDRFSP